MFQVIRFDGGYEMELIRGSSHSDLAASLEAACNR